MASSRPLRSVLSSLAIFIAATCLGAGCGDSSDQKVAKVDPEYQKQTSDMLKEMSKQQMEKYKAKSRRR